MQFDEWETGNVTLEIGGAPVEMQMTVPSRPVKAHRMLPIFQQMANTFVDYSVGVVEANGLKISCKAGCGACCRQAVPISEAEAFQLAELVEAFSEPRRTLVKQRFAAAVAQISESGWFDEIKKCVDMASAGSRDEAENLLVELSMKYFHQGVACPFLENESCSIHDARPLVCREYLVTSPAENCAEPSPKTVAVVPLLIKASRALRRITRSEILEDLAHLPLIRALEVAESRTETLPERAGRDWMADFFQDVVGPQANQSGRGRRPSLAGRQT